MEVHAHESSTEYNMRVQDRDPNSVGCSDATWEDCRVLRKYVDKKTGKNVIRCDIECKKRPDLGERTPHKSFDVRYVFCLHFLLLLVFTDTNET